MLDNCYLFKLIRPFEFKIKYLEIDSHSSENQFDSHIHDECEIYINLSGDVSFVVENSIYPIVPGSIIVTRPFEHHHCVYHSNKLHKHYWILFSALGNEYLFDKFYKRNCGENNLLILDPDKYSELISVCKKMTEGNESELEKYLNFFKMTGLLHDAAVLNHSNTSYPEIIVKAMKYINDNISYPITVTDISQKVHVSINTLERHFLRFFNVSPSGYIRKKRLANAARLLSQGCSVTQASEKSGFSDCAGFISLFKRTYGQTPLEYKKTHNILF
ncbi:MAG: AraC family transcriptional regulator [Eubacteriales bacterium]|nr:AraC family transcriptional regulator [Eubacteriales bacterium]